MKNRSANGKNRFKKKIAFHFDIKIYLALRKSRLVYKNYTNFLVYFTFIVINFDEKIKNIKGMTKINNNKNIINRDVKNQSYLFF